MTYVDQLDSQCTPSGQVDSMSLLEITAGLYDKTGSSDTSALSYLIQRKKTVINSLWNMSFQYLFSFLSKEYVVL